MRDSTMSELMDKPKYSVIVPVYNRVAEVKDLTDSLLAQTVKNFELVPSFSFQK